MPSPTRITLPLSVRPVGGLISAASPTGVADWTRGVKFSSGQCLAPFNYGPCESDDQTPKDYSSLSSEATFEAFNIVQAVQCSTLGRTSVADFANASLDVTREFGVGLELLAGAATGNPSLADATTPFAAAADPVSALGCLEQHAADELSGRLAFIHVAPLIGTHLLTASAIWRDGATWRTATGNKVVISPAYDGRAPADPSVAPAPGDPLFMYATGEVYVNVGSGEQRETNEAVDRSNNTLQGWAEDVALVLFDPCFNVAIDSGLTACESGS